jgi:hypothetical protein
MRPSHKYLASKMWIVKIAKKVPTMPISAAILVSFT